MPKKDEAVMTTDGEFKRDDDFEKIRARPRVYDFFTLDGVERMTGCIPNEFLLFMIKELVDNALDKQEIRNVKVEIREDEKLLTLSVSDDGNPTFDLESLAKVLDFEKSPSKKRGLKKVSRGILGNALQSCFGISYSIWPADNRPEYTAEVWSDQRYLIKLDPTKVTIEEEARDNDGLTTLLFKLPIHDYVSPFKTVETIALINQHVNIFYKDKRVQHMFKVLEGVKPPAQTEVDLSCYSLIEFLDLANEMNNMTVEKFVTIFKGLKHRTYAKKILDELGIEPGTRLSDLSSKELQDLYNIMRKAAKTIKASQLPIVGEESFYRNNAINYFVKRGVWNDEEGKIVPYAVEAASFEDNKEEFLETINFTVSIHNPFTMYVFTVGEKRIKLHDLIKDKGLSV